MQQGAEFSLPGLIISVLAIPIMYFLSRRKLQVANELGSRSLRTDAIESITCGWLALVVVAALAAQLLSAVFWKPAKSSRRALQACDLRRRRRVARMVTAVDEFEILPFSAFGAGYRRGWFPYCN